MQEPYPLTKRLIFALQAACYLAGARVRLHRTKPSDVIALNAAASARSARGKRADYIPDGTILTSRVAYFIPRMALRLPWRTDCLVQALAGQSWLKSKGVASEIAIGTAKTPAGAFEAHAWLMHGDAVILGGNIDRYSPLLSKSFETDR